MHKSSAISSRVTSYHVALDSEYVQHVIKSVSPDAIIFFGAFDDRYNWRDYHRCSAKYVCDLTNILVTASDLNISKFIYLSSVNVYGFDNEGDIDESQELAPGNVKSIIVAQGERLCKDFSDRGRINAISLRFGTIYGDTHFQSIQNDYILKKCLDALVDRKITVNNQVFPVIAVSDAAIAVYKSVTFDGESGPYNVCDSETISDAEIVDIILTEYQDYDIEIQADETFQTQAYNINGEKFKNQYLFFQKVQHRDGIADIARYVRDNLYKFNKIKKGSAKEEKKSLWFYVKFISKKLLPFIETVVIFALFVALSIFLKDIEYFEQIDFMLIGVILVALTFGKTQAIFFLPFAIFYYIFTNWGPETSLMNFLINMSFLVYLLMLFTVGMMIGHTRDKLHEKIHDNTDRIEYLESEYNKLDEINDVTISIKQVFEDRLIAYGDSLAKNYSLIEDIDTLIAYKTYMRSLSAISSLLKSLDIAIYLAGDDPNFFNLEFWTTEASKKLGTVYDVRNTSDIFVSFNKGEMFINKELSPELPVMATTIRVDDEIKAIIMIWSVDFEALTMHHINLFTTLTKIVTNAIEKSSYYCRSLAKQFRLEFGLDFTSDLNAYFLSAQEFVDALKIAKESKRDFKIPFSTLSINLNNISIVEAMENLKPILNRVFCMYRSESRLEILFNNSTGEEINNHLKTTVIAHNAKTDNKYLIAMESRITEEKTADEHLNTPIFDNEN